jgi:membrane protease subunit HflC
MQRYKKYYPAAGAVLGLILIYLTFFSVRETEFVLITQFGRPVRTITDAGLKAKWFFQTAIFFDRRLRVYNPRPSEFLTRDRGGNHDERRFVQFAIRVSF